MILIICFCCTLSVLAQNPIENPSDYVGEWESRKGDRQLIIHKDLSCVLGKKRKVILDRDSCRIDLENHTLIYTLEGKKGRIFFRLDGGELLLEEDLRSLTREKADMILHRIGRSK